MAFPFQIKVRVLNYHAPQAFRISTTPSVLLEFNFTQDNFLREGDGKDGFGALTLFWLPHGVRETVQGIPAWQTSQVRVGRTHGLCRSMLHLRVNCILYQWTGCLQRMEYTKGHTFRFARGKLTGLWHGSQLASATKHTKSINPVVSVVPITNHNMPNWKFRFR